MTNLVFGKDTTIEKLIILIGMWIALFVIVKGAVGLIPVFEGDKIEIGVSLVVTVLMIMTGVVEYFKSLYLDFIFGLEWVEKVGPLKMFVALAIIGAIAYGIYKISEMYKEKIKLEEGDVTGENLRTVKFIAKTTAKSMD
jgi:hypothetical protein